MEKVIFAGKGVTAAIRHNPAKEQCNVPCEEHMIGAWTKEQMLGFAIMMATRKVYPLIPIIASETDILLAGFQFFIRIKLITPKLYTITPSPH